MDWRVVVALAVALCAVVTAGSVVTIGFGGNPPRPVAASPPLLGASPAPSLRPFAETSAPLQRPAPSASAVPVLRPAPVLRGDSGRLANLADQTGALAPPPPVAVAPESPPQAPPPTAERVPHETLRKRGTGRRPPPAATAVPVETAPLQAHIAAVPAPPVHPAPIVPRPSLRHDGVLTAAEIARLKAALRLTPDQIEYWTPVEPVLREIGLQQMAQVRLGKKPDFSLSTEMSLRLYWAAAPLLRSLREDQKAEIRRRARAAGLEEVASKI